MKFSQSKLQNRSTSSSQYFKKRFGQNQLQQQYQTSTKNLKSYTPSNISPETSKIVSEYQIFKSSKSINQPQSYFKINIYQTPEQKRNPFLSSNYNFSLKNKEDKIYQNKTSKPTFGINNQTNINPNTDRVYNQYFNAGNFVEPQIYKDTQPRKRPSSNYKQNIQTYTSNKQNTKYFTNTQLLQPITLLKSSSSQGNLFTSKVDNSYLNQSNFSQNQPHQVLQHIHFTIANESNFSKIFKTFANEEKQKINSRFKQVLMQIENILNQIQIVFQKRVDQSYQLLLSQLNTLKSKAGLMWKNKNSKSFSPYKNLNISQIQPYQGIQTDILSNKYTDNYRPHSNSKYTYKKLSQSQTRSPESNNILLNQLYEQDKRISEYKTIKRFYFNQNQQRSNQIDRDKLLKQMHQISGNIARLMKQCQNLYFDEICLQNRDKHKSFIWFNSVQQQNIDVINKNNNKNKISQNINTCIKTQLSQFCTYIDTFRSNIKHKYLSSKK